MLDTLLGRAGLKAEIEELEAELADCQAELEEVKERHEAADRRRREAIREGQEAQEERNRLRDRVEQLTDELERVRGGQEVSVRSRERLGREEMSALLRALASLDAGPEGAYTAMLTDGDVEAVREHLGERRAGVVRAAPCLCLFDRFGLVEVALQPPIEPAPFERWDHGFHLETEWFLPEGSFTFALVRADLFARGTFDGETLAYDEGFDSDVMGRHSKGGYSQARFERRREEQIEAHLDRVTDRLRDTDDSLVLAGSQEALDRLSTSARVRVSVDASGPPREALEAAFEEVWTTTVHRL